MIYIVIPCYNESQRLPVDSFKNFKDPEIQFLFVNDGSTDDTLKLLQNLSLIIGAEILSFDQNLGKAEAVRQGINYLIKTKKLMDYDWIGFWDADLATPLYEIKNFFFYRQLYSDQKIEGIWGSRVYRLGAIICRNSFRHYMSRIFATVMFLLFRIKSYDSQCGAKIFSVSLSRKIFNTPFISRWIFDIEILIRAQEAFFIEYPLKEWHDIPGSKITLKEVIRIVIDIFKIFKAYKYFKD